MNKIALVIQREYLVRVKKKSFLYTTILVPIVIVAFYALMISIAVTNNKDKSKIAVIDNAHLFNGKVDKAGGDSAQYTLITDQPIDSLKVNYKAKGFDYALYIPQQDTSQKFTGIQLFSQSTPGISQMSQIEKTVNKAIEQKRLLAVNISTEQYRSIKSDIDIENKIMDGKEEKKGADGAARAVSFACGILIYIILLIYGTMVMRGVMEEKINRIAEVIVSSVKPFQLMMGKIIGIGAVGLTQFAIWILLIFGLSLAIPLFMPDIDPQAIQNTAQTPGAGGMGMAFLGSLGQLHWGFILPAFIFYFLGGYMLYASVFAALGSVVSEDQQEAQQMVFPVMMPIILSFVIMSKTVTEPNSPLAVFGSLFPLTSPVVMMGRITNSVPLWQVGLSMLFLVLGILFFTWLTAKIYRTGILLYGKKVTWKEMVRWAFRKS
jgi:ABC-2 type transport system permease protein